MQKATRALPTCRWRPASVRPSNYRLLAGLQHVLKFLGHAAETRYFDAVDLALYAAHRDALLARVTVFIELERVDGLQRTGRVDGTNPDDRSVSAVRLVDLYCQRILVKRRSGL